MKLRIIGVAALALALCWAANAWAGGLTVSQNKLEFGKMKEGLKAERVVILQNTGSEKLKIANVKTS